jgi:protein tyrosine phosphatase (PTP) superfamily phosphohydrolase (DUF442 family)
VGRQTSLNRRGHGQVRRAARLTSAQRDARLSAEKGHIVEDQARPPDGLSRFAHPDPATPWRDPHPAELPRPGTRRLPSEEGAPRWHGFSRVADRIYVGGQLGGARADDDGAVAQDAAFLRSLGIRAVLDMRLEGRDEGPALAPHAIVYRRLKVQDHYAPSPAQLDEAVQFVRAFADHGMDIYVHCHVGQGRSPTVVMAYLISQGRSLGDVLAQLETARNVYVRWNHADLDALREYAVGRGRPELATPDADLPPHQISSPPESAGRAPAGA